MSKIVEIYKLFHPETKTGGKKATGESKDQQIKRLRAIATARKQKLLRKGIKI